MLHSLKEITIIPTTISDIDSRSEGNETLIPVEYTMEEWVDKLI